jgi:hypothetical protein
MFRNNLSPDSWLILICSGTNWLITQVKIDVPEQSEFCWQLIDSDMFRNKLINYPSENKCFGTIWDIVQVNPDVPEQSESWQLIDFGWFRNKLNYNTQVKINVPEQSESWQLIGTNWLITQVKIDVPEQSEFWQLIDSDMFRNKLINQSSENKCSGTIWVLTIDWFWYFS